MPRLKITTWNIEHLRKLFDDKAGSWEADRRKAIVREIRDIDPDVLCILEGPAKESDAEAIASDAKWLGGDYVLVKAADGKYATRGSQWIWFLVKAHLGGAASLLPVDTWDEFAGAEWMVNYWGDFETDDHSHYRHPQVLVLNHSGIRVEFIGLHLKSKFVQQGESDWKAGGQRREKYIRDAVKARIKLATEAANVRAYIDAKFAQTPSPAIFVMGDLNDGPGKELFERQYLFFDLLSNIQGDVFFARRFLNHALFDFASELRWSAMFDDFTDPSRDPRILLDHIMFTQSLVDGSLPWQIHPGAGLVEHEVHELVNAGLSAKRKTSDHRPVSVFVDVTAD